MQPKDFVEKNPKNDKRLQKKLANMAKDLDKQKAELGKYKISWRCKRQLLHWKEMLLSCESLG